MKPKLKQTSKISKWIGSDLPISLLLLSKKNKMPKSVISFLFGLSMLHKDINFDQETLKKWFINNGFKEMDKSVTINGKKYESSFDFYFNAFQSNFFSKKPIIVKSDENTYRCNKILPLLNVLTPHKSIFKVRMDTNIISQYKGDMSALIKDMSFQTIKELVSKCNNTLFTNKQIENIFGLNKRELNKYIKESKGFKDYQFRTIGFHEAYDLELDSNKHHKVIKGFRLKLIKKLNFKFDMKISTSSLFTIKERLEKHQNNFYSKQFFSSVTSPKVPKLDANWQFNEQYELLGFKMSTVQVKQDEFKKYIDIKAMGKLVQKKNIYNYLKENFDSNYSNSFKASFKSLVSSFI